MLFWNRLLKLLFQDEHINIRLGKFKCLFHKAACPRVSRQSREKSRNLFLGHYKSIDWQKMLLGTIAIKHLRQVSRCSRRRWIQKQYRVERKPARRFQSLARLCKAHSSLLRKCMIETESPQLHPLNWSTSANLLHPHIPQPRLKDLKPLEGVERHPVGGAGRKRTSRRAAWWGTRRHSSRIRPHNPTSISARWRISASGRHGESSRFCTNGAASRSQGWPLIRLLGLCSTEQRTGYFRWSKRAPAQSQTCKMNMQKHAKKGHA